MFVPDGYHLEVGINHLVLSLAAFFEIEKKVNCKNPKSNIEKKASKSRVFEKMKANLTAAKSNLRKPLQMCTESIVKGSV